MTFVIPFPSIDPVLIEVGPIAIRWYALAYVFGLLAGWRYMRWLAKTSPRPIEPQNVDDFLVWATLGVVVGGRLGYVLFYQPAHYLAHPIEILATWQGGMSFHGGFLGVVIAAILFARRRRIPMLAFGDTMACAAPIGLFLGRLANFVNGELYGRISDAPWAMVFPTDRDGLPRHPSQLYQAVLEGAALFVVLFVLSRWSQIRARDGLLTGAFLIGYALARSVGELFREPDSQIGFLLGGSTMGQWLSLPMLIVGLYLVARPRSRA